MQQTGGQFAGLGNSGVEVAAEEEGLRGKEETGDTRGIDNDHRPESGGVAEEFGDDAAQEDAETHANVPGDQDGRVGRATLVVAGYVDGHVLEGRPHVTVAQTDKEGRAVVAEER